MGHRRLALLLDSSRWRAHGLGGRLTGSGGCGRVELRRLLTGVLLEILGLAKEGRQRPFTHRCPLRVCHEPRPPVPAGDRTAQRHHPARTSAPTFPSQEPPRSAPSCVCAKRTHGRRSSPRGSRLPPWHGSCAKRAASGGVSLSRRRV